MKSFNTIFYAGVVTSLLVANYISPVIANRAPPSCYFYHQKSDKYPIEPIEECRDVGRVATYIGYNNYGIEESDFNDLVNNSFSRIKILNYTLSSSVLDPNPYNYFPVAISNITLEELELNCKNDFSTDANQVSYGTCLLQDNVISIPTLKKLTLRRINLTNNNMKEIAALPNLEKLSFYDNDFSNVSFKYLMDLKNLTDLSYTSSSLTALPRGAINIKYFPNVKTLTLSGVQLSTINTNELNRLYALEKFTLDNAYFSDDMTKFNLLNKTNLNEVILDYSDQQPDNAYRQISVKLPEATKKLFIKGAYVTNTLIKQISTYDPNLEELYLKDVFYSEELDFNRFGSLKSLTKLTLENNHNTKIKNFKKLQSLKYLKLEKFDVTDDLIMEIGKLTNLEELYIINSCGYLNDEERKTVKFNYIKNLTNLKIINFGINKIKFEGISEKIPLLTKLEEILIYDNKLSLDKNIRKLTNLKQLKLFSDGIDNIPKEIGNLKNLTVLNLSFNDIKSLPSSFTNLTNLEHLDITMTNITTLPDDFGNLKNLKKFYCVNNLISSIPNSFCQLKNMEEVLLRNNIINEIPECIENLENLKILSLSNNNIFSISDGIFKLWNLENLELSKNNITRIPNKFDTMRSLKYLDLSENNINDKLPDTLNNLYDLDTVYFNDNKSIDGEVLKNNNLKRCYYCNKYKSDCSSKECYDYMNLPLSTDGRCGKGHARCAPGICCSKDGYCDPFYDQCFMSNGCQPKYGTCKKPCMICELDMTQNDFEFDEDALPTSHNGRCGKDFGTKCPYNYCCNKDGVCTGSKDECKVENGCQEKYENCIYSI